MLKILDRYLLKKFMSAFFFTALIFSMIALIIDFSEKIEKFIEEPITTKQIFVDYYPSFILYINGLLWPLFTLISVIFFTSRLAYNSEIISILNAGVSFRRFLRPYLIGAGFIATLLLIGNHYVIPNGNNVMLDIVHKYIHKNDDKGQKQDVHLFVTPDTKIYVKTFFKDDSSIRNF
ncbi:MAG: LptF/LptG family permease, partial [Bacteroidota bacterium]